MRNKYNKVLSDCLAYIKKKIWKEKIGSNLLFYSTVYCEKERYFKEEEACKKPPLSYHSDFYFS